MNQTAGFNNTGLTSQKIKMENKNKLKEFKKILLFNLFCQSHFEQDLTTQITYLRKKN